MDAEIIPRQDIQHVLKKGIPVNEGLLVHLPGTLLPKIGIRRPQENVYVEYKKVFLNIKLTDSARLECNDYCQKNSAIIFQYPLDLSSSPAPGMVSYVSIENKRCR